MPHIEFTTQLAQHVECPASQTVDAGSLRELLEHLFGEFPKMRDYVIDEGGAIRQHISVFVDGDMIAERHSLDVPIDERSEVFVMQALAGG